MIKNNNWKELVKERMDIIDYSQLDTKYVNDGIQGKIENSTSKVSMIVAGCGKGKNFWLEQFLINFIEEKKMNICILSDRISNNRQMKKRIAKLLKCEYLLSLSPEEFDKREKFGGVWIKTYQKFSNDIKDYQEKKFTTRNEKRIPGIRSQNDLREYYGLLDIDYLIMDECQIFCTDNFNFSLDSLLNTIINEFSEGSLLNEFSQVKRIYMTGTPDSVFNIILRKEIENLDKAPMNRINRLNANINNQLWQPKKNISIYDFKTNFKFIENISFFDDIDELQFILKDFENDSSVTFVDNSEKGMKLKNLLGDNAIFVCRDGINSSKKIKDAYDYIIENEELPPEYQHLIATTVLADGINLKQDIRHVIITLNNQDEFIQSLGRRRIKNSKDKINLYIQHCSLKNIFDIYNDYKKKWKSINLYYANYNEFIELYDRKAKYYKGLFKVGKNGKIQINNLAKEHINEQYTIFKDLYENYENEPYKFLKIKLSWIQRKTRINKKQWISYANTIENKETFLQFLRDNLNLEKDEEQFLSFGTKFKSLYKKAYGARKEDNGSRPYYGITIMKSVFVDKKLNYQVVSKKKKYTLTEK